MSRRFSNSPFGKNVRHIVLLLIGIEILFSLIGGGFTYWMVSHQPVVQSSPLECLPEMEDGTVCTVVEGILSCIAPANHDQKAIRS